MKPAVVIGIAARSGVNQVLRFVQADVLFELIVVSYDPPSARKDQADAGR